MKRFDYLDIAKGIGILLVVWAHILLVGASHRVIYAFHMPLFFFISGLLFNKDKYTSFGSFLKQRAKRLMLPYFFYSVATWVVWAGFRYIRHDEVDSFFMPLLQTFIAQGSGEFMVHNSALWFIPCLMAVEVIYYFCCKVNEWFTLVLCFCAAGLGGLLMHTFSNDYLFLLPWNLDAALFALPFYGVANAIKRHLPHERVMALVTLNRFIAASGVAILFLIMSNLATQYGECSMGSSSYGCSLMVFFARAFLGCFALIGLSALICSVFSKGILYDSLKWCGENSLDIMCLHIPIKGVAIILVAKVLHLTLDVQENWLYSGIAFLITLVVMIPIVLVINSTELGAAQNDKKNNI